MKTNLLILLLLLVSLDATTQTIEKSYGPPTDHFLGMPSDNYTSSTTENIRNQIWYGKSPANSHQKPVLVFVHGFNANHTTFTDGPGNMYNSAYKDGYRSAYVSLTPDKSMWFNAWRLRIMLWKITNHYKEKKVTVVAWSKGGVDTDAAITFYDADRWVDNVISLGSPHYGTYLAEAAHEWWFRIFDNKRANPGSRSIQRGYMNWFRWKVSREKPANVNFYTMGGWGDATSFELGVTQKVLYLKGGE